MKAGKAIAFTFCVLFSFSAVVAGCVCPGPGEKSPRPTLVPTASPRPETGVNLTGWGIDQETYARGATATGWVNVTNTGTVPIDEIDFTLVIRRTVLFLPVEKRFGYNLGDLDIRPGETKKVQFSQTIPAEYEGISTAGDYKFVVTASIAGKEVGSYAKDITVS
jgi:hypothetical protein